MSETLRSKEQNILDELLAPRPEVVVVTGGPGGGKTTGLHYIQHGGVESDRPMIVLPEYPSLWMDQTGLNLGEIAGSDRQAYLEAQKAITQMSIDGINGALESLKGTSGVVIADRGAADPGAYMTPEEERIVAESLGYTAAELRHNFADRVIFLRSLGVSYPEIYEEIMGSNIHRYEDAQLAHQTDERLLDQWRGHSELHIIDTDIEQQKYDQLGRYVLDLDSEYERKWIVMGRAALDSLPYNFEPEKILSRQKIEQVYRRKDGMVFRTRDAFNELDHHRELSFSVKQHGSELRRRITQGQKRELAKISEFMGVIFKTRHTFYHDGRVWDLDQIHDSDKPFWILETEASSPQELDDVKPPFPAEETNFSNEHFACQ